MSGDDPELDPELWALLHAGFTANELQALAGGMMFAYTIAAGMEQSTKLNLEDLDVDWTPDKHAAWDAYTQRFLADLRAREEGKRDE